MTKKVKNLKNPMVSVCTPTFNRRPFIPYMIKCFEHQTYDKNKIEWIIIDDGTDPIRDLVEHIPQVKYFYVKDKMELGAKRNYMHTKCSGDIIVYMDDDDYYPPERISHAVDSLMNSKCLIAGSSEMHVYFNSRKQMYKCGPYGPNHATAATFAFKKELLKKTKYDDNIALSEEKKFTDNFSIPMVQLDTLKTICVFSHTHNSLNKERLLDNMDMTITTESKYTVDDFVKDPILKQFYTVDMDILLTNYEPGRPENKPVLMAQIKDMDEKRAKKMKEMMQYKNLQNQNLQNQNLQNQMTIQKIVNDYEKKLSDKNIIINELMKKVKMLTDTNRELCELGKK